MKTSALPNYMKLQHLIFVICIYIFCFHLAASKKKHSHIHQQYHGAARLAFGQNPEIVSSTSTSTTTTTTQIPVSTAMTTSSSQISIDNSSSGVEHESTSPIEITNNGERRSGNMNAKVLHSVYAMWFHNRFSSLISFVRSFFFGTMEKLMSTFKSEANQWRVNEICVCRKTASLL